MILTPHSVLKEYFGYDTFRPIQEEIINYILSGNDALVLMPTGGGKSICYQIPALINEGICIVISPLIALMKDQVEGLKANGVSAAFLNSSNTRDEQNEIEKACFSGEMKILYIAPEKLMSGFLGFIKQLKVNLFAIDEAHCISFWGHDFRPEYKQLNILRENFPNVPLIALTATADKLTRKDIMNQLGLDETKLFISSFDRPNISLNIAAGREKLQQIGLFLNKHKSEPGIIYCLSRKSTEDLAMKLIKMGFKAKHYHAGMDSQYRSKTQDEFSKDDIQIIVATVAFGMGIDKSNVRWIIHYNLPKNIESYYQEIGRAGRDGLPADALLFYSYADVAMQTEMLKETPPDRKEIQEAKLERLKQYCETDICRRRVLLSYFNEIADHDCGNCDVCRNPPKRFDATILAQKALSAIVRTEEKIAMSVLIDILRGSNTNLNRVKAYDQLKTFGAGRDLKTNEWADYISQMLNSGVMDIAYDDGHKFKLNESSKLILKGEKNVQLAKFVSYLESGKSGTQTVLTEKLPKLDKKKLLETDLLTYLKNIRKELADQQMISPYLIFNDKTLEDMAQKRPANAIDMLDVTGVSNSKYNLYGTYFTDAISDFLLSKAKEGHRIEGSTFLITYDYYKKGLTPEQIAKERNLNAVTIYSHLVKLFIEGKKDINLAHYVTNEEVKIIYEASKSIPNLLPTEIKPIFELLEGKYQYHQIRIALSLAKFQ